VTGGDATAAVPQRNAIAVTMSVVARLIAPVYIILSLLCGGQKRQNALRETLLGNHRRQSQQS
jgi:hypothetical protein